MASDSVAYFDRAAAALRGAIFLAHQRIRDSEAGTPEALREAAMTLRYAGPKFDALIAAIAYGAGARVEWADGAAECAIDDFADRLIHEAERIEDELKERAANERDCAKAGVAPWEDRL